MTTLAPFSESSSFLQVHVTRTIIKALIRLNFDQISIFQYGVSCPWASEKSKYNGVTASAPSLLNGSSAFLQVMRTG